MNTLTASLGDNNKINPLPAPRIDYTLDYSFNYEKHNSDADTCAQKVIQLATSKIQDLPDDEQEIVIAEIHGFPGIDQLYGLQSSGSNGELLTKDQIGRIRDSIQRKMQILAQEHGLVCSTKANMPGTSLVLNITQEYDLDSNGIDSHISGISTSYQKSLLKVSLQKVPSNKIIPIPSLTLAERIGAKIKKLF